MKILYINHYAGSPFHGMEFRPYYLAREWIKLGHEVTILAGAFSHIRAHQPVASKKKYEQDINGIKYCWYPTPAYYGNGIRRAYNIFKFLLHVWEDSREIAARFKPDIVMASSTYPMDIWPAHRIARLSGAKLVFEVHDLWPLSPIELGNMSRLHPFILLTQFAEDYAYRHAVKVISMLPKAKSYMESRGMAPGKFGYVPNGVDVEEWQSPEPLPDIFLSKLLELKQTGLPIVAYIGTFGIANALNVLLDAAINMKNEAQFILVGTGPELESLNRRINNESISNVSILAALPKSTIPSLLDLVDIAYIGWHKNPMYRFGISPNKLADYMMAGKPIIHSVDAGNDPVKESGCGITVPPDDALQIAGALKQLMALSADERAEMGLLGRNFILNHQTYSILSKKFLAFII